MRDLRLPAAASIAAIALLSALGAPDAARAGSGVHGDANCSGRTDAIDASLILQLDAALVPSLPCQSAGDVDHSGVTNSLDSSLILQRVALLIPTLPALITLDVETAQPVAGGEEFVVEIRVEDVEHLASFGVELSFDPEAMTLLRFEDVGAILAASDRNSMLCFPLPDEPPPAPLIETACSTFGPPVCLGGPSGPSGDGTLARAVFRAGQPGTAAIGYGTTALVWDDISPCDPQEFITVPIPHQRTGTTVVIE